MDLDIDPRAHGERPMREGAKVDMVPTFFMWCLVLLALAGVGGLWLAHGQLQESVEGVRRQHGELMEEHRALMTQVQGLRADMADVLKTKDEMLTFMSAMRMGQQLNEQAIAELIEKAKRWDLK